MCNLGRGKFLVAVWNQSGLYVIDRSVNYTGTPAKPFKIEDPKYNSHTTDLKPLFPNNLDILPYIITRNKNAINLVDLNNRHV